jgi:hypothetical protein
MTVPPLPPTLGPAVADWIEGHCVHGPGEVIGRPAQLTDDHLLFLYRLFELRPDGRRRYRRACFSRSKGSAKDLALDTPVLTMSGWKTQGSLEVDDRVFDENGDPCRVVTVHPVRHDVCYRVTFSDGTSIVAGQSHPWPVVEFTGGRSCPDPLAVRLGPRGTSGSNYVRRTITTGDMADAGVMFPRPLTTGRTKASKGGVARYRTLPTPELQAPDAELPVPPWTLGYWLGNGSTADSRVTCGERDVAAVGVLLDLDGTAWHPMKRYPGRTGADLWLDGLNPALRRLGVLGDKHIPRIYLQGSAKQRLALLQGLMDSDGTASRGRAVFSTTTRALFEGFLQLARSLGLHPSWSTGRAVLDGRDLGPSWRVDLSAYSDSAVFRLERKQQLMRPRPAGRRAVSAVRTVRAVELVPTVPTRCITVDSPSHLYLAGEGLVPTHNTELAAWIALAEALGPTRCGGFDAAREPVGVPATSPDIMCLATEEGQAGLAYSVIHLNLTEGPLAATPGLDAGLTRTYLPGGGIIRAGTSGAASKDGLRPTLLLADEPLALDTAVATVDGWKTVADLVPGDHVFAPDGKPVLCYGKTPVKLGRPCYRLTFDDGSSIVADHRHSWEVYDRWRAGSKRARHDGFEPWRTMTTEQIYRAVHQHLDGSPKTPDQTRFGLRPAAAVQWAAKDLPLDPYVLGLWLGDGDSRAAKIAAGEEDRSALVSLIEAAGFTVSQYRPTNGRCAILSFNHGRKWAKSGTSQTVLREMGLLRNKHVPAAYLTASVEQRLALLQGLMDSDGSVNKRGNCVFVNKDAGLCDAVVSLVRSLGWRCTGKGGWESDDRWGTPGKGKFRVSFTPDGPWAPFRLRRKAERCRSEPSGKMRHRGIASIEPAPSVPVACIAVDSDDHLFLAGESFMTTHNTHLMTLPELKELHATAWRGIFKRPDALLLETTTAFRPGQMSVAEAAHETYRTLTPEKSERLGVLYDHRGATCEFDALEDPDARMAALLEAYGPAAAWMPLEEIAGSWDDPSVDPVDWARYWTNMVVASADTWLDPAVWAARAVPGKALADGDAITLGLDTALRDDATALVACRASDGHLQRLGCWQRPDGRDGVDWITPFGEVDAAVREAFARYRVLRLYCDPQYAEGLLDGWSQDFGRRVYAWPTNRAVPMEAALRRFWVAARTGEGLSHDGDQLLAQHVGNARTIRSKGRTVVGKDRPHSPRKIDLLIAAVLAFEAAADARTAGEDRPAPKREYRAAGF